MTRHKNTKSELVRQALLQDPLASSTALSREHDVTPPLVSKVRRQMIDEGLIPGHVEVRLLVPGPVVELARKEASSRGTETYVLLSEIVSQVVRDKLYAAVLDD